MSEPGDPDPVSDAKSICTCSKRIDFADHFVPWRDLRPAGSQISLGKMKIGTADATCVNPHPNLSRPRHRVVPLHQSERAVIDRSGPVDYPGAHVRSPF